MSYETVVYVIHMWIDGYFAAKPGVEISNKEVKEAFFSQKRTYMEKLAFNEIIDKLFH